MVNWNDSRSHNTYWWYSADSVMKVRVRAYRVAYFNEMIDITDDQFRRYEKMTRDGQTPRELVADLAEEMLSGVPIDHWDSYECVDVERVNND